MERVRGERTSTGRAIVSGASSMLDMLRRSRRPPVARRSLAASSRPRDGAEVAPTDAAVGLEASVASGLPADAAIEASDASVASGLPASKSALDERQLLLGRPPTSPPSPNRPPSRPRAWGASNTMPYRQLPPPQRWIRAHSGSKGGRCSRFEAAPRSVRRGSALCKARAYASVLQPLAKTQRGAVRILPLRQPAPTS